MKWETVIGLEVHAELATQSKMFCSCSTKFGSKPNSQCCPVCMGFPGSLPTLNKKSVELALKTGIALNCEINRCNQFDRKNYFYPDLPKAYQISQLHLPLCRNGTLPITTGECQKTIHITQLHMEEDAGKLVHNEENSTTSIDYNRCGVPLIEIVTAPDFQNADEVLSFLEQLKRILLYIEVCDCKMQEGSLRADINLSVRPEGSKTLGIRTEMKNLNSFRAISRAIKYESERQISVLENGGKILQETRRWDDDKGISLAMRNKENLQDYRYFPEPDLPPIEISDTIIDSLKKDFPELPLAKKQRYCQSFGLSDYEADTLTAQKPLAVFFEKTVSLTASPKETSNWILGDLMSFLNDTNTSVSAIPVKPEDLAIIIQKTTTGKINRIQGKEILAKLFTEPINIEQYIKENDIKQITDDDIVRKTVKQVLTDNNKTVEEYLSGKTKVFGFFVGNTMRALKGQADPSLVNNIIQEELDKLKN